MTAKITHQAVEDLGPERIRVWSRWQDGSIETSETKRGDVAWPGDKRLAYPAGLHWINTSTLERQDPPT